MHAREDQGLRRAPDERPWPIRSSPDRALRAGVRATMLSAAFRENRLAMYGTARRICGDDLAADVVQEVFLRVWKDDKFDHERASIRTYLLTMTRGVAVDSVRKSLATRNRDDRHAVGNPVIDDDDDGRSILALEAHQYVRVALEALSPNEREVLVIAFYERLTYRRIAERLGIPEGTVKSRARIGLIKLRHHLREFASDGSTEPQA